MTDTLSPQPSTSSFSLNSIITNIKSYIKPLNISIGFFGIQFAWAVQTSQMSPLLERLGSEPWLISLIWAAGPITGVLVQPIVGTLSDEFKSRFGRRRPFLLIGALLTAISLILMPNSPSLLIAALLLWVLDASINLTQGPYRALVPDVVEKEKQTTAYAMMSFTIGLGSVVAFYIAFYISSMHSLFYLGADAMLVAMLWTTFTVKEPSSLKTMENNEPKASLMTNINNVLGSTFTSVLSMPKEGLKLCFAHAFTWFGLMCLFVFFSVFVPKQIFAAAGPESILYNDGVRWASLCYAVLNGVCFIYSPFISKLCAVFSKKAVHTLSLLLMAASYIGLFFVQSQYTAMLLMGFIGIGWASTLSIPFAMLSDHLPKGKEGVLMGTFNIFIAAPGVLCSFLVGPAISLLGGNEAWAFLFGGVSIVLSALLLQLVKDEEPKTITA